MLIFHNSTLFEKSIERSSKPRSLLFSPLGFCSILLVMSLISILLSTNTVAQEIGAQTSQNESEGPAEASGGAQVEENIFYPIPQDPAKDKASSSIFLKSVHF